MILKKSIKYLIIATINWLLLRFLLTISTDKFDVCLEPDYIYGNIISIYFFTFLSLIGMRIFVFIVRKKVLQKQTKMKIAAIITLVISSHLYFHFITKYKNDIIKNSHLRRNH